MPLLPGATALALLGLAVGCGSSLPTRRVVERDLGAWRYSRYQQVLDVEFPMEGASAVGHTASYVRRGARDEIQIATAFVTVYARATGLAAEIRDRLEELGSYETTVGELGGETVWWLDGGGDRWAMWVSGTSLIKLGAPADGVVPSEIIDAYTTLYPSDLDEHGYAEPDAPSAGLSRRERAERAEDEAMPDHLREGAPR